jgi:hypothetical protein
MLLAERLEREGSNEGAIIRAKIKSRSQYLAG